MAEPRAKRTHARRSCGLCKVRKTRCELPDLEVAASSEPLPFDKSCHRCRVLALPCVVDDSGRKQTNKKASRLTNAARARDSEGGDDRLSADVLVEDGPAGGNGQSGGEDSPGPSKSRSRLTGGAGERDSVPHTASRKGKETATPTLTQDGPIHRPGKRDRDGVNHSLEVTYGIVPSPEWQNTNHEPSLYSSDPFLKSRPTGSEGSSIKQENVLKLHGRPLEIVCAMLRTAYARSEIRDRRASYVYTMPDWDRLIDARMKADLEIGFSQLCTFHPYLDPLPSLFQILGPSPAANDQLLLCTVLYLCTLPLAPSAQITKLRSTLRPQISYLRDRVLLQMPTSFNTLQALELLGLHAPLGPVPLQVTNPRSLSLARGQIAVMQSISNQLGFQLLFAAFTRSKDHWHFYHSDIILFMSVAALEASMALEDEVPKPPASLKEARYMAARYLEENFEFIWPEGLERCTPAAMLGRLGVCDRLARLGEVLDSIERLRGILETAVSDYSFNPVDAIVEEFGYFAQRMDKCDARHDRLLTFFTPHTNNLECGYLTHRSIRRRYEHTKILAMGLRYLIATAYLPGTPMALPNLPNVPPNVRVQYAIERASTGADIIPVLMTNSVATMTVWQYGLHRGEICQQILTAFAELERVFIPQPSTSREPGHSSRKSGEEEKVYSSALLPLHECVVFALEAAKVLMEMRAGSIILHKKTGRLKDATVTPPWLPSLKAACHTLRRIGLLSPSTHVDAQSLKDGNHGESEGETIANGCSNILGSMVRVAEEWGKAMHQDDLAWPSAMQGGKEPYDDPYETSQVHPTGFGIGGGTGKEPVLPGTTTIATYHRDHPYHHRLDAGRERSGQSEDDYRHPPHPGQHPYDNSGPIYDRAPAPPMNHADDYHSSTQGYNGQGSRDRYDDGSGHAPQGYAHSGIVDPSGYGLPDSGAASRHHHQANSLHHPDHLAPLSTDMAHQHHHDHAISHAHHDHQNSQYHSQNGPGYPSSNVYHQPGSSDHQAPNGAGAGAGAGDSSAVSQHSHGQSLPQGHNPYQAAPGGAEQLAQYDHSPYGSGGSYPASSAGHTGQTNVIHAHQSNPTQHHGHDVITNSNLPNLGQHDIGTIQDQGILAPTALDMLLSQMFNYGPPPQA